VTPATRLLKNGYIYTFDPKDTVAEAIAIDRNGQILFVGNNLAAGAFCDHDTVVTDLAGRLLLPGFADNHTHASAAAAKYTGIYLGDVKTVPEYLASIRAFAQSNSSAKLPLVTGGGWEQAIFQEYNRQTYDITAAANLGPSRFLLDEALGETALANVPVVLYSSDLHCAWYNSVAIELARGKGFDLGGAITGDTGSDIITRVPQAFTGEYYGVDFSRYRGQPWGVFREGATRYIDTCLPPVPAAIKQRQARTALRSFIREMHSYGITLLQDILISPLTDNPHADAVYRELKAGREHMLWQVSLLGDVNDPDQTVREFRALQHRYADVAEFSFFSVKLFADATLKGMYVLDPYADDPDNPANTGCLYQNVSPEAFKACIATLHHADIPIHIHAMGDRAVQICLDGLETAQARYGAKDLRHTLTHLLLARPEDIRRMARLNVVASLNSYWHYQEPYYYEEIFVPLLGPRRAAGAFPARSFWDEGVLSCMASDGTVSEKPAPLWGIEIAVTRNAPGATDRSRLHNPSERLSRRQAIAMCTINGAHALGLDRITGSLEAGKRADMIILDKNILTIPAHEIHSAEVLETIVQGKTRYSAPHWQAQIAGQANSRPGNRPKGGN
jgi:predicted amidohydrolase YtcJ